MKLRAVLGATAAAAALLCAQPAAADPFAGSYRYVDGGRLDVVGADGTPWQLHFFASQTVAAGAPSEQQIDVDVHHCTGRVCKVVGLWRLPIDTSQITVAPDLSNGEAHGSLGGLPLSLALTSSGVQGAIVSLGAIPSLSSAVGLSAYAFSDGALSLGSSRCAIHSPAGEVGQFIGVAPGAAESGRTPPPARLPTGLASSRHPMRCARS